jgi:hypothetical protein
MSNVARPLILVVVVTTALIGACREPDITQRKAIGVAPVGSDIGYAPAHVEYKGDPNAKSVATPNDPPSSY